MQFKIYDILSSLIPGTLVLTITVPTYIILTGNTELVGLQLETYKELSGILTTSFLVVSYLTGYIIHALGSWFEFLLWVTWGGRPSSILLKGKSNRVYLADASLILDFLKRNVNDEKIKKKEVNDLTDKDFRQLFQIAKYIASVKSKDSIKERIGEFNNSYIFSRNILAAFIIMLIFSIILASYHYLSWWLISILAILLFLLWYRCKDKAFYHSREVLAGAYYSSRE